MAVAETSVAVGVGEGTGVGGDGGGSGVGGHGGSSGVGGDGGSSGVGGHRGGSVGGDGGGSVSHGVLHGGRLDDGSAVGVGDADRLTHGRHHRADGGVGVRLVSPVGEVAAEPVALDGGRVVAGGPQKGGGRSDQTGAGASQSGAQGNELKNKGQDNVSHSYTGFRQYHLKMDVLVWYV